MSEQAEKGNREQYVDRLQVVAKDEKRKRDADIAFAKRLIDAYYAEDQPQ